MNGNNLTVTSLASAAVNPTGDPGNLITDNSTGSGGGGSGVTTLVVNTSFGASSTYNGTISDSALGGPHPAVALFKDGQGTLSLGGTGTYSGGTLVKDGTLNILSADALPKGTLAGDGSSYSGGMLTINDGDGTSASVVLASNLFQAGTSSWQAIVLAPNGLGDIFGPVTGPLVQSKPVGGASMLNTLSAPAASAPSVVKVSGTAQVPEPGTVVLLAAAAAIGAGALAAAEPEGLTTLPSVLFLETPTLSWYLKSVMVSGIGIIAAERTISRRGRPSA